MQNSKEATMTSKNPAVIITPGELLEHWQGHRRVTRKVIEAFPGDKLFDYSSGGMRPFSELAMEMIQMAVPGIQGVVTGEWRNFGDPDVINPSPETKQELLELWDWTTRQINQLWPQIPPHRFQEIDVAFGQYEGKIWWHIFYFIDNEIHHRGQGYVYLRSLGIEPPFFWDRN